MEEPRQKQLFSGEVGGMVVVVGRGVWEVVVVSREVDVIVFDAVWVWLDVDLVKDLLVVGVMVLDLEVDVDGVTVLDVDFQVDVVVWE